MFHVPNAGKIVGKLITVPQPDDIGTKSAAIAKAPLAEYVLQTTHVAKMEKLLDPNNFSGSMPACLA